MGVDFENRTLHAAVTAGHKRLSLFLAKGIVFLTASCCILTRRYLLRLSGDIFSSGEAVFQPLSGRRLRQALSLWPYAAMGSLPFFLAFVCRDVGKTLSLGMSAFFLMIFLLNLPDAQLLAPFIPMGAASLPLFGTAGHTLHTACFCGCCLGFPLLCGRGHYILSCLI